MESSSKTTSARVELNNGMVDCDCELLPAAGLLLQLHVFLLMKLLLSWRVL